MRRPRFHLLPLAACALLLAVAPADAARIRYLGRIASDLGPFLRLRGTVRPAAEGVYTGRLRCLRGPVGRCFSRRGVLTISFTEDGFEADMTFRDGTQCFVIGTGTPLSTLRGEYACDRDDDDDVDSGVLRLNPRRR